MHHPTERIIHTTASRGALAGTRNSSFINDVKSALDLPRANVGVPYTDFKHLISQYMFSTWQYYWNGAVANKLHCVKPVLGDWLSSYRRCRKNEVVLCRARIGHTYLTHSYILKKDPPVYSDSSPHFGGVQSSRADRKRLVDVVWWNLFDSTLK